MADEVVGSGSIVISLDDTGVDAAADRIADRIERSLDRAARLAGLRMQRNINAALRRINPATVRVEADLTRFNAALNGINNLGSAPVRVVPDVDRAQFEAAIQAALAGLTVSVRVVPDLDDFDARIRAHRAPTITVDVDADRSALTRLTGLLNGLGRAAGSALTIGSLGIAAAGAAQGVAALTAALAPAVGIVAALPAVIATSTVAMGTLKLATAGVGEAFGALASGDAEALEDALKALSPAAREAVLAVGEFIPQLKRIQQGIQNTFFAQFGDSINAALKNLVPLGNRLKGVAEEFGNAADQALRFAATEEAFAGIKSVIDGTANALSGLSTATQPVLKGLLDVAAAVAESFGTRLGDAIGQAGAQFGTFLSGIAASGRAVELVENALQVFEQLGEIASNVGGIISGAFRAANDAGGGLLNNLEGITARFEDFVDSAQGQEAIGNLFQTLSTAAAQLGPVLAAIVTQIGAIAPSLGPLFEAIGPAITSVINAIGPAIQNLLPGIQSLVDGLAEGLGAISDSGALGDLASGLSDIFTALAPLLPLIGELAASIGAALQPTLSALAEALTPIISALTDALVPILPPLTSAFITLVTAITPLVTLLGDTLGQVITALAPLLLTLSTAFSDLVTALAPLLVQLTDALVPILPPLIESFTAIVTAITPLVPVIVQLVAALTPFVALVISAAAPIILFAAEVTKWLALNAVAPVISTITTALNGIVTAATNVVTFITGFVTTVTGLFGNLKSGVTSTVSGMVTTVVGFFAGLPGRAVSAVTGIIGGITGVFNRAKTAAVGAVTNMINTVVGLVRGLPGQAAAALSGISGALVSAGADLIKGFISGVKSMAGAIASAAKDVVQGAIDGAKSLLGISSPSKVFAEIGRFTGQGFVKGLTGTEPDIKQAADKLVSQIKDAFKGRNSRLDDALISQVRAGQRELTELAKQRASVAEQIKKANDLAASVTQGSLQAFSLQNLSGRGGGAAGLIDGLEAAVNKIRAFDTQVNRLAERGLRKDLLSQIIGLGPDQGAGLATSLSKATDAQLADLNEAQKRLAETSRKLGKDSADALFDAGSQASKGFLAGLKDQQKDIEDLMLTIAKSMAKSIRSALGIRSPSKVFRDIGRFTLDGLSTGLQDRMNAVRRTAAGAASALTDPFGGAQGVSLSSDGAGRQNAVQSSVAGGRSVVNHNNFTIHQVSSEATAQMIMNRLAVAGGLL